MIEIPLHNIQDDKIKTFSNIFNFNIQFSLFSPITPKIAIAVSGGIDSLALLLLTINWIHETKVAIKAKFEIHVLTVDHDLRPSSLSEAEFVKSLCNELSTKYQLNIIHEILTWKRQDSQLLNGLSNIQSKARDARYQLMTQYCYQHDILTLLTGHHDNDKIENFFIRLSRASGVIGLAESNVHYINNVKILRPLIGLSRINLKYIIDIYKITHIEDPSNSSTNFFRSELRLKLKNFLEFNSLPSEIFEDRILHSLNHLSSTEKFINQHLLNILASEAIISPLGWAKLKFDSILKHDISLLNLVISHLLITISGNIDLPRSSNINNLIDMLSSSAKNKFTLHDCIIEKKSEYIIIYKEISKITNKLVEIENNIKWDKRFNIVIKELQIVQKLYLSKISFADYISNKKQIKEVSNLPSNIILTLPAIKDIENLLAIPHINYYRDKSIKNYIDNNFQIFLKPNFFSRLIHYIV